MDEELKREQATTQIAKPDTSYTDPYAGQLRELYTRITERKPFEYNADDDSMYQQYRDRYMSLGREAMKDTIGQASALTGGYGSSYAQSVGHQAYDKYLLGLNDKALELYEAAYGRWKDDENRDRQNYAMLGDLSDREYGKWSDQYNRDLSKYELGLDEAGLRAQYGDFSGYADIYGDEAAAKISKGWAMQNPDAALAMGVIDQGTYAQLKLYSQYPALALMGFSGSSILGALGGGGGDSGGDGGNWYKATGTYNETYNPTGQLFPGAGGSGIGVSPSDYYGARAAGMTHQQIVDTVNG